MVNFAKRIFKLEDEKMEAQIEDFIAEHPEFRRDKIKVLCDLLKNIDITRSASGPPAAM
jgi:hypothetical protein